MAGGTTAPDGKIGRDAFLYMDPQKPAAEFAQCGTCEMFISGIGRCAIHGPRVAIDEDDSCGLYVHGTPSKDGEPHTAVTPPESGLVKDEQVRCENCRYMAPPSNCGLYAHLNQAMPDDFELDEQINPKGCCNAMKPKAPDEGDGMRQMVRDTARRFY